METNKNSRCAVVRDLLPLFEDGALSRESETLVKAHLAGCESCRAYRKSLRECGKEVPEAPLRSPDEDGYAAIARRYKKNRRRYFGSAAILCAACLGTAAYFILKEDK